MEVAQVAQVAQIESKQGYYLELMEEGLMTHIQLLKLIAKEAFATKEVLERAKQSPKGCCRICCPHWTLVLPGAFSLFFGGITGHAYWVQDEFGETFYPIGTFLSFCLYGVLWRCSQKARARDIIFAASHVVDMNMQHIEKLIPLTIEKLSEVQTRDGLLQIENNQLQTENGESYVTNYVLQTKNIQLLAKGSQLLARNGQLLAKNRQLSAENRELLAENSDLQVKNSHVERLDDDLQIIQDRLLELEAENSRLLAENGEIETLKSNPQVADILRSY